MKTRLTIFTSGLFIAAIFLTSFIKPADTTESAKKEFDKRPNTGFAVVELFTSEGCSSCPPADELVAKVQEENLNKPVYILAFHVDYWDLQGWKDVFSDNDFTKRQSQYVSWLHTESV